MQYYRCKCGKTKAWTSMGVPLCSSCKHCGSDLAQSPESHGDPEPHEYVTKYDPDTGVPYERCRLCLHKRSEIEAPPKPESEPPPTPSEYELLVRSIADASGTIPHCDMFILHAPGMCEYCDAPSAEPLRVYRVQHGINFTGENDPTKKPCPAEQRRSKEHIDRWPGNRAKPKD